MSNTKTVMGQASNQYVAPLQLEDVFSTYLYTGDGGTGVIVDNGIDLAGEGGMVWIKARTSAEDHVLFDTERGVTKLLESNTNLAEQTNSGTLTNFYSDGFRVDGNGTVGSSTDPYASWTFRKAPKFFTCLTYTGTGSAQNISHNLGSVPGMIVVKKTNSTGNWPVYHRGMTSALYGMNLNSTLAEFDADSYWDSTDPTDSVFTVGNNANVNASGSTYVAYLFAHNDGDGEFGADGDLDAIKCGSYVSNETSPPEITLGFEPQWILIKKSTGVDEWAIFDNMRGVPTDGNDAMLRPNLSSVEYGAANQIDFTPTGFKLTTAGLGVTNAPTGETYIYMAIRRGTKVPESATEVFDVDTETNLNTFVTTPWPTDLAIQKDRQQANQWVVIDRMRGGSNILDTSSTSAENTNGTGSYFSGMDYMDGIDLNFFSSDTSNNIVYNWKRAPKFFDVVAYTGNSTAGRTVSHNLGVAPEMLVVKRRDATSSWETYVEPLGNSGRLFLNLSNAFTTGSAWNNTSPTDTEFTLGGGSTNDSGGEHIAYLFASLPGISKVGSFTHSNGSNTTVDCGFTSGARFVLVKQTDLADNWFVFDTERGITVSDSPALFLNNTNGESGASYIEPTSSGFIIKNGFWSAGNFIFYAIA